MTLTPFSLSRGLCPSPLIPKLVEGSGSGPSHTDLRQISCHFFELHRLLLIVGVEILDGVGKGHSKIWEAQDVTSVVYMEFKAWKDPPITRSRSISDTGLVNGEGVGSSGGGARHRSPTCPRVRYVVLHLQEDEESRHGKRHVALTAQAQMVVSCGTW